MVPTCHAVRECGVQPQCWAGVKQDVERSDDIQPLLCVSGQTSRACGSGRLPVLAKLLKDFLNNY